MKIVYLPIISLILNLLSPGVICAKNYSDVPHNHKYFQSISTLSDKNIINGYNNGEFHPEGDINRAEAIKILVESKFDDNTIKHALDWHHSLNHWYVIFPDVGIGDWFSPYVKTAHQNNIIQGYPDGTFGPSNHINFAEALKIILESYNINVYGAPLQNNPLLYVKNTDWFAPYFAYAYEYNLINQNKFYHPGQLITRGEFVEIIYRLETVLKTGLPEFIANHLPISNEYRVTIPKLNIINLPVSFADPRNEDAALAVLKRGLGHYLAPPDTGRKTVLFGHSSGYSWDNSSYKTILKQIDHLQNGDKIYINYKEKGYIYEIFKSDIIPATEDYKIVENQYNNELALYTCWPPNQISHRYVVYGKPIS